MNSLVGQRIGNVAEGHRVHRYLVKSLLGKQTGRRTFLAEDSDTGCLVVLKLILFGPDFTWEDLKLFEREAETLRSLDHLAIPKYLNSFEVETAIGKGFVLVQTYIEAKSLQAHVAAGRRFSEDDLKSLATDLLEILQYLHGQSPAVIHRDIKPSNILLGDRTAHSLGKVYLADFGSVQTAATSGTMTVAGTYGYMPPEQFGGRSQPASDLYSLGATLIFLTTGKHPADLTQENLQIVFDDSHLSLPFSTWLRRLTYADVARRTASAAQAIAQLNNLSTVLSEKPPHLSSNKGQYINPTFADLGVHAEEDEFELQCSQYRLDIASVVPRFLVRSAVVMVAGLSAGILFINAPSVFWWTFLLAIPCLPVLSILAGRPQKPKSYFLQLRSHWSGNASFSLLLESNQADLGWSTPDSREIVLFSDVPVGEILLESRGLGKRLVLLFNQDDFWRRRKLVVKLTRKESRWLREHFSIWGRISV